MILGSLSIWIRSAETIPRMIHPENSHGATIPSFQTGLLPRSDLLCPPKPKSTIGDNDDRRLLSGSRQRRQQLSLPLRIPHS